MHKILIVGDAPSSYNLDPGTPFIGAKCYPRLKVWMQTMELGYNTVIINQCDYKFMELLALVHYLNVPVVALGNKASKALKDIPHFKLPHPSGLNRQINDKNFVNQQLSACKSYILYKKTL